MQPVKRVDQFYLKRQLTGKVCSVIFYFKYFILFFDCFSYSGHSMSDPGTSYRSRDEIQEVRQSRDPITSLREKILSNDLASAAELKTIETEVKAEVDEAHKKSKIDSEIAVDELTTDVYSHYETSYGAIRNVTPENGLKHTSLGKAVNL